MPKVNGPNDAGDGILAVVLTLRILEALAEQSAPVGITELSRRLDTTKSRVSRHIQTLLAQGYVARDEETERYRSGPRLITLGHRVHEEMDFVRVSRPHIRRLRDELGSLTAFSTVEDAGLMIVSKLAGDTNVQQIVRPGTLIEYDRTAQGAVALAFAEERVLRGLASSKVPPVAPLPQDEAAAIRARGWALTISRWMIGINALAVPVFDGRGDLVATVGIIESVDLLPDPPAPRQIRAMLETGRLISEALGFGGRYPGLDTTT